MFSSLGYFRSVRCPQQHDCSLLVCIFSHNPTQPLPEADETPVRAQEYDPFSAGGVSPPPVKRRRLQSPLRDGRGADVSRPRTSIPDALNPSDSEKQLPSLPAFVAKPTQQNRPSKSVSRVAGPADSAVKPASVARTVSPPPMKAAKNVPQHVTKRPSRFESLTPRGVNKAPAMLKTRLAVLQKLHEQMKAQNGKLAGSDAKWKSLVLDEQELITFALDEEEAVTKLEASIYKNTVSHIIMRYRKMTTEEWIKKVSEWTEALSPAKGQAKPIDGSADLSSIGLHSLSQKTAVLRHLRTPLEGLEKYGYVTTQPSPTDIASAKAGVAAAKGFESCDRCGSRFQVFPGRDDSGHLTSGGICRYHWARANRQGRSEAAFPCCSKPEGSEGCSQAKTHVFTVKAPKRLASILQFEHTPAKTDVRPLKPVSFDCEMGYTTLGMEVIRVTAVSWPAGELLFDVFVRTYGEILDLNTRFSGVTTEAYGSAMPYFSDGPHEDCELRKVDSPAAARQLLCDLISPETPVLGHAIENDLNVVRLIHPFVVDTVLLYPHPRGLPVRFGLKILSQKHLLRGIQMAGDAGHDSKEDAVATGDLVTKKVAEKWKIMQHEGWHFVEGILTAPEETGGSAGGQPML